MRPSSASRTVVSLAASALFIVQVLGVSASAGAAARGADKKLDRALKSLVRKGGSGDTIPVIVQYKRGARETVADMVAGNGDVVVNDLGAGSLVAHVKKANLRGSCRLGRREAGLPRCEGPGPQVSRRLCRSQPAADHAGRAAGRSGPAGHRVRRDGRGRRRRRSSTRAFATQAISTAASRPSTISPTAAGRCRRPMATGTARTWLASLAATAARAAATTSASRPR